MTRSCHTQRSLWPSVKTITQRNRGAIYGKFLDFLKVCLSAFLSVQPCYCGFLTDLTLSCILKKRIKYEHWRNCCWCIFYMLWIWKLYCEHRKRAPTKDSEQEDNYDFEICEGEKKPWNYDHGDDEDGEATLLNLKPVSDVGEESLADLLGVAHRHGDRLAGHHWLHPGHIVMISRVKRRRRVLRVWDDITLVIIMISSTSMTIYLPQLIESESKWWSWW